MSVDHTATELGGPDIQLTPPEPPRPPQRMPYCVKVEVPEGERFVQVELQTERSNPHERLTQYYRDEIMKEAAAKAPPVEVKCTIDASKAQQQFDAMTDRVTASGVNPKDRLGATKPSVTKVPPAALIYMALAMQDGARKYGPYNWRENKVIASIYLDATIRHILAFLDGEEVAADSGRPHLAHALASLAILVDAKETGNLIDDRPIPGAAPELIERYTVKS